MADRFSFFLRAATDDAPCGTTVSKTAELPEGDFGLTEYKFGTGVSLWFVDGQKWTGEQRLWAFQDYVGV